jgi:hypothetical protein
MQNSWIQIRANDNPNPAGWVYFNAMVPADATGAIYWYVDLTFATTSGITNGLSIGQNIDIAPAGTHLVTGVYSGDSNYLPSSAAIIQTAT